MYSYAGNGDWLKIHFLLRKYIHKLYSIVLELIFPRRCPVCDHILHPTEKWICTDCVPKIKYIREPRCMKCGKGLQNIESIKNQDREYCQDCATKKHIFDKGLALYDYNSMKTSIFRFKYNGRCEYADFFGRDIARHLGGEIRKWDADAIVPIPIHYTRRNKRGYNQAELIANRMGEELQIPVKAKLIKRTKKTIPQKELDAGARQNNLKKAFNIVENDVKLKTIILIDDIYTTGSTIDAVAGEFRRMGDRKSVV